MVGGTIPHSFFRLILFGTFDTRFDAQVGHVTNHLVPFAPLSPLALVTI